MLVDDPYPRAYLQRLHGTARVRAALGRKNGPRKSNFGCWPVGDTILGLWVISLRWAISGTAADSRRRATIRKEVN